MYVSIHSAHQGILGACLFLQGIRCSPSLTSSGRIYLYLLEVRVCSAFGISKHWGRTRPFDLFLRMTSATSPRRRPAPSRRAREGLGEGDSGSEEPFPWRLRAVRAAQRCAERGRLSALRALPARRRPLLAPACLRGLESRCHCVLQGRRAERRHELIGMPLLAKSKIVLQRAGQAVARGRMFPKEKKKKGGKKAWPKASSSAILSFISSMLSFLSCPKFPQSFHFKSSKTSILKKYLFYP